MLQWKRGALTTRPPGNSQNTASLTFLNGSAEVTFPNGSAEEREALFAPLMQFVVLEPALILKPFIVAEGPWAFHTPGRAWVSSPIKPQRVGLGDLGC